MNPSHLDKASLLFFFGCEGGVAHVSHDIVRFWGELSPLAVFFFQENQESL